MTVALTALTPADLPDVLGLLNDACEHDRAAVVAAEKLLGPCPRAAPTGLVARDGAVIGVAATCCDRIRVLAVHPAARGRGVGSQLLSACEAVVATRAPRVRLLDEPGNYLAPGIDEDNRAVLAWLERRGYRRGETRINLRVAVRDNPRVTTDHLAQLTSAAGQRGYQLGRALPEQRDAIIAAVGRDFGGAWRFEVERAMDQADPAVHVAWRDRSLVAFAAHDGNNRGLGWFGPAGTWPVHRGNGLGEALLVACLVDIAAEHPAAEIAWIGPRQFYERAVGIIGERRFVAMSKDCGMVAP